MGEQIPEDELGGAHDTHVGNAYRVLVKIPEAKRLLEDLVIDDVRMDL
jgi:hypothetical protein